MSIYHCSIKNHSYSKGQDPIATIAYRSGEKLRGTDGSVIDYSNRKDVAYTEIILPEHIRNVHPEYSDRQTLWAEIAKVESKCNGRFIREFEVALPKELSLEQMKELVHDFTATLVNDGMIIDFAIHQPKEILDKNGNIISNENWHCHISCSTRKISSDGGWEKKSARSYVLDKDGNKIPEIDQKTGKQKVRVREGKGVEKLWKRENVACNEWNKKEKIYEWRKCWESCVNNALTKAGYTERVDCRSLEDQGIERLPQMHVGISAKEIEKKQNKGVRIPYGPFEDNVKNGIYILIKKLDKIRNIFDVVFRKKIDITINICKSILEHTEKIGMTRNDENTLIKAKNDAIELLDRQIFQLEKELADLQNLPEIDARREQELYERLEKLRYAREDSKSLGRDADRKRNTENREEELRKEDRKHRHRY